MTSTGQHHPTPTTSTSGPTLLITRNTQLAATVTALASPDPAPLVITPDQLPSTLWPRYPLILIDADTAPETAEQAGDRLAARTPLVVSATPDPTPHQRNTAIALGAEYIVRLPRGADWLRGRLHTAATLPPTRVITVLDVCGDPHGTTLATALGVMSSQAGHDTLLAIPHDHPTWPDPAIVEPHDGDLMLLTRPGNDPIGPDEITAVVASIHPGDIVILDATTFDTPTAQLATALADITLLVAGPWATQLAALSAAADTIAHLAPHAHQLGLVLSHQRPCHTPADALTTQITTAATRLGWTRPLPTHTWHTTTAPDHPTPAALHDLAQTLLRDHLPEPPKNRHRCVRR